MERMVEVDAEVVNALRMPSMVNDVLSTKFVFTYLFTKSKCTWK